MRGQRLFLTVVADCLNGTTFKRFHTLRDLFFSGRLLLDVRVATFVMAREERGRGLAAKIAVDALLIDVECTRRVLSPFVSLVRHSGRRHKEINYWHCQAGTDVGYTER